jgi:hypothetical protein
MQTWFYSDEARHTLSGYVNSQNNRYWSTENPHAVHVASLHDLTAEVCLQLPRG